MMQAVATMEQGTIIGGRYRLLEQLGAGGMGRVYRVFDRLLGEMVALKRVNAPAGEESTPPPTLSNYDLTNDPRITLAREFQAMSTLRHPHILGVLDYGFEEGQPYFTMELLEGAKTIFEYAYEKDTDAQIAVLVQVLQALMYIHRRGMIHRDLKPGNVLVAGNQVKVLDFGLSTDVEQAVGTVGTLAYMPPEVLFGEPAGPASDLYALGIMAYEIFAGRHPFLDGREHTTSPLQKLLDAQHEVDVTLLPPTLAPIIARMLDRQPGNRYQEAAVIIAELSRVTGRTFRIETRATRESFLQAARFIGRERELTRLKEALLRALDGNGSAWLVGGESGVGKSRLVDELRTLALVRGALVLRSSASVTGSSPYLLWRNILRGLVLVSDISDVEASILSTLLPDIGNLLERPVPPAPGILNPADARARLFSIVTDILRRQERPVVIILEDLQWASSESLQLLDWLNREVAGRPLLLVGNYRDDERAELPELLPGMNLLPLKRLSSQEIVRLSESMLGPSGREQSVLSLLQRETEGNPFFLVEVVRALAEEVGQLDMIGTRTLPARVITGGLAQLVQRRLEQVPVEGRPLLQLAAIAGRHLDLRVLRVLAGEMDLEEWLTVCANAAVLDVQDDRWRFAHDKLRDGVLVNLTAGQTQELHCQVAEAIESVYGDAPEMAARLVYHWAAAGETAKERYYAHIAGREALRSGANQDAVTFLERAWTLELAAGPLTNGGARLRRAQVTRRLGQAYLALGRMLESQRYLEETLAIAGRPVPRSYFRLGLSLLRQLAGQTGHRLWPRYFVGSVTGEKEPLLFEAVRANQLIAEIYYFASQRVRLIDAGLKTLNYAERIGPSNELARAYGNMSIITGLIPLERLAETYARLAIDTAQEIDDLPALAWAYLTTAVYVAGRGQWARALALNDKATELCHQTADKRTLGLALGSRSLVPYYQGYFRECIKINRQWTETAASIDNLQHEILGLIGEAECLLRLGRPEAASEPLDKCTQLWAERPADVVDFVAHFRQRGVRSLQQWRLGNPEKALQQAAEAMELVDYVSSASQALNGDGVADVAEVYLSVWEQMPSAMTPAHRKLARQACSVLNSYARAFVMLEPRTYLLQGLHEWLRGRKERAVRKWRKGLAVAEKYEQLYDEARLRYRLGLHAEEPGRRTEFLERAAGLLRQLGAVDELAQVEAALHDA